MEDWRWRSYPRRLWREAYRDSPGAYATGYRDREWERGRHRVELRIPKLRNGSYFPSFWSPADGGESPLAVTRRPAFRPSQPRSRR